VEEAVAWAQFVHSSWLSLEACIIRRPGRRCRVSWYRFFGGGPQRGSGDLLDLPEQRVRSPRPCSSAMNARVPTLPTPTTLRAMSIIPTRPAGAAGRPARRT
jgi:hypothetical protein